MNTNSEAGRLQAGIVSYYARPRRYSSGGVNTSRQQWMAAIASQGHHVEVVAASGGYEERLATGDGLKFRAEAHWGNGRITMLPRKVRPIVGNARLVYLHEGWTPSNVIVAAHCVARGIPYVVLPHGVYEPKIVKTLKPFPGRERIERWVLEHALAVHLFFRDEVAAIEAIAPSARTVVAMTGMPVPDERWHVAGERRYVAWLGRYDPLHKGIDVLLRALSTIPTSHRPLLRMHGADYAGGKAQTKALVEQLGLSRHVKIGPELDNQGVRAFLLASDAFVTVPRWEAFGRTILESMALGVPTIVGDGARIASRLGENGVARICASGDPESVAQALVDLPSAEMADAGRRWVLENASWDVAAQRLLAQLGDLGWDASR